MILASLQDDLLAEFREERELLDEQVDLLEPLADSLRKPAAQKLVSTGTLILMELICYVVSAGGLAFVLFIGKIYPFKVLSDIFYNSAIRQSMGMVNLTYLCLAVYGIVLLVVILVFILGRGAREIRLKNEILRMASQDVKAILGQHLRRRAAITAIEQRHKLGMPGANAAAAKLNSIANPAYDENDRVVLPEDFITEEHISEEDNLGEEEDIED